MKILCLLFISAVISHPNANASGCDWDQSGLTEVSSIPFKTSGTLTCMDAKPCTFAMNSIDGNGATIILTGPKKVLPGQTWLKHLDGKFKKLQEYGSCYDDGEVMIVEVVIDRATFSSSQLSYDSPDRDLINFFDKKIEEFNLIPVSGEQICQPSEIIYFFSVQG